MERDFINTTVKTIKKGTVKRELTSFEIRNCEAANIIIRSLSEKGFDIITKPIRDGFNAIIGEEITVYRTVEV